MLPIASCWEQLCVLGKAEAGLGKNCVRLEEGLENCPLYFFVKVGANCNTELHKYWQSNRLCRNDLGLLMLQEAKMRQQHGSSVKNTNVTSGWMKSCV